ncbi:MAG: hypothetical protein CMF27_04015 [Kiritimatiellaceae bacterium]|jgi:tetratricopeptide (TPR) repeat protein|nr:hypothetical protein [Kiritimatiellaceae bacterium]
MDERNALMKSILYAFIGLTALLLLFVGCGNEAGDREHQKAQKALQEQDLIRARSLLEKSLRETISIKAKIQRSNQLGLILWELNEPQAAAQHFHKAIELGGSSTTLLFNQAVSLLDAGQLEEANLVLQNLQNQNPDHPTIHALLGLYHLQKGALPEALQQIEAAQNKKLNHPTLFTAHALIRLQNGDDPAAIRAQFDQRTNVNPAHLPLYFNLAMISKNYLNDLEAAQNYLTTYLASSNQETPRHTQAQTMLDEITLQLTQTEQTLHPAQVRSLIQKGTEKLESNAYTDAINLFREAIQQDPQQRDAYYNLGLAHYYLNNFTATAAACQKALDLDNTFANARYMLALAHYRANQLDQAEAEAQQLATQQDARAAVLLSHIETARQR